jgi:hypothetical protein
MKVYTAFLLASGLWIAACGGGGDSASTSTDTVPPAPTAPPATTTADVMLLFMGNSHTSANDLTGTVAQMVRIGRPERTVAAVEAPGWMFLEQRVQDAASMQLLRSRDWSFVILQAQKYSTSGQFTYSTEEAKQLVRAAREQHALPVLFPEWPRRGIDETQRIYDLHVSIAQVEPACVAPIGQAWDLALARHPNLVLHASDGNHSAPAGAFLTALVLYATITQKSVADLPTLTIPDVDAMTQSLLRAIAQEAVTTTPPRMWCPSDVEGGV